MRNARSGSADGRLGPLLLMIAMTCCSGAFAQSAPAEDGANEPNAIVEQPRAFGYTVGDLLTQRVLLRAQGRPFEPDALAQRERLGTWFERRSARIEADSEGRRWLLVQYQLINAPQALSVIPLPAWNLRSSAQPGSLHVAAWPISIAPVTPRAAFDGSGMQELRPDRPAPQPARGPIVRGIHACLAALAIDLAAWLAWWLWRNRRDCAMLPFADAARQLRAVDEGAPQAWQVLHRAFDGVCGAVLRAETIPSLFSRAPYLAPARARIELFYAQSSAWFFDGQRPPSALSPHALCAELRRLEERQAR